jgi:HK97 family phage major capsid protein
MKVTLKRAYKGYGPGDVVDLDVGSVLGLHAAGVVDRPADWPVELGKMLGVEARNGPLREEKRQQAAQSQQDGAELYAKLKPMIEASELKRMLKRARKAQRRGRSFGDFLRGVERRDSRYLSDHYGSRFVLPETHTKAALAEGSGPTGGYTVPPRWAAAIYAVMAETNLLRRNGALVLPMMSATLQLPYPNVEAAQAAGVSPFFGGFSLSWAGEGQTRAEAEPQVEALELRAWELSGYCPIFRPLMDDAPALGTWLLNLFGRSVGWFEDYAFLQGNGVGKPQGILSAGATVSVTRQSAGQISYLDVSTMIAKLPPASYQRAFWAFAPTAQTNLLQLKDGAGRAVFLDNTSSPPSGGRWSLAGFPAFPTEKLPALGTKGDLLLIDPAFYVIEEKWDEPDSGAGILVSASEHPRFTQNQVVFRVLQRVDGQPLTRGAITLQDGTSQVSPFVVLN